MSEIGTAFIKKKGDSMYCQKCGAENNDDVKFCSKCGNPLGSPGAAGPDTAERANVSSQSVATGSSAASHTTGAAPKASSGLQETQAPVKEKKLKTKDIVWIVVGVVVAVFVIYSLVPRTDWIASVKAFAPYSDEGYNQSIGTVMAKYMPDAKYSESAEGDVHIVTIKGTLVGADDFTAKISMTPYTDDLFTYVVESVAAPNADLSEDYLETVWYSLWLAYEEGVSRDDFEDYADNMFFSYY